MSDDILTKAGYVSLFLVFLIAPTFYKGVAYFITNTLCFLFLIVLYKVFLNNSRYSLNSVDGSEVILPIAIFIIVVIAYYFRLLAVVALVLYIIVTLTFIILQYWLTELWNNYKHPHKERSMIGTISLFLTPFVTVLSAYLVFDWDLYNDLRNTKILNIFNLVNIQSIVFNNEPLKGMAQINFQNGLSSLKGLATTSFERLAFAILLYNLGIKLLELFERQFDF